MTAVMALPMDALFICLVKTIYFSVSYCKPVRSSSRPIVRFHRGLSPGPVDRMWDTGIPRAVSRGGRGERNEPRNFKQHSHFHGSGFWHGLLLSTEYG